MADTQPTPSGDDAPAQVPLARSRRRRAARWLGLTPVIFVGGIVVLVILVVLVGGLIAAGDAALKLPLEVSVVWVAVVPLALILGFAGRVAVPRRDSDAVPRTVGYGLRLVLLWGLTAAGAYMLENILFNRVGNNPAGAATALAAGLLVGWVEARVLSPDNETWWTVDTKRFMPAPVIVVVGISLFTVVFGIQQRQQGTLYDYCAYGAVSQAQLNGCLDHVSQDQISRLNTDAARFANGDLSQCLSDSGPFCAGAVAQHQYEDQAPDPNQ